MFHKSCVGIHPLTPIGELLFEVSYLIDIFDIQIPEEDLNRTETSGRPQLNAT